MIKRVEVNVNKVKLEGRSSKVKQNGFEVEKRLRLRVALGQEDNGF